MLKSNIWDLKTIKVYILVIYYYSSKKVIVLAVVIIVIVKNSFNAFHSISSSVKFPFI